MTKSIKVFAPATVANVSCGFDVLGFAVESPGDEVEISINNTGKIRITEIKGDNGTLPYDSNKNTVSVSIHKFLSALSQNPGFDIKLNKKMPLGSGLGSSAASSVAGVYAVNELLDRPFTTNELLSFALEGERIACGSAHADNVAPALLGGFVLIRSYDPLDIVKLPTPDKLYSTIIHPHVEVETKDARSILRKDIKLKDAVTQFGNIAGLIAGLYTNDYDLISRSMQDVIVEPVRSILIPGFQEVKTAGLNAGALGCGISGSGPSIFALSTNSELAKKVGEAMTEEFKTLDIQSDVHVSKVNQNGPLIIG